MCELEHLTEEGAQVGTASDNLTVDEPVEDSLVVHPLWTPKGSHRDSRDVLGVTENPIEVKNYEEFMGSSL